MGHRDETTNAFKDLNAVQAATSDEMADSIYGGYGDEKYIHHIDPVGKRIVEDVGPALVS